MSCSHNYGPLLVIDYITAPNTGGYQKGTLMLETTHIPDHGLQKHGSRDCPGSFQQLAIADKLRDLNLKPRATTLWSCQHERLVSEGI